MTIEEKYKIQYINEKRYYQVDIAEKLLILDETIPFLFKYKNIEIYESSWNKMALGIVTELDRLYPKNEEWFLGLSYWWSKTEVFSKVKRTNFKTIHVKIMSEDALIYLRKNVESISTKVSENETNEWIYDEFPKPMFVEKSLEIYDFELERSPESSNKEADYRNAIKIYEHLKKLPRYIICDERFWLWLHFEKFYSIVRDMMKIRGSSTIKNAWMHEQGTRRGLMFGVLSRLYFRVEFSVDESKVDISQVRKEIAQTKKDLSESTIIRRSSTIKSWVEWMFQFDKEKTLD